MNTESVLSVETFIAKLQELSDGLYYISESDYPLKPVQYEYPAAASLNTSNILTLTSQPPNAPVEVVELTYFFRNMTKDEPEADEDTRHIAQRYRDLQAFLEQQLPDIKVYRIGRREILAFGLGKLNNDCYAGFKTTVIET